jgi:hypothetical protein
MQVRPDYLEQLGPTDPLDLLERLGLRDLRDPKVRMERRDPMVIQVLRDLLDHQERLVLKER